MTTNQTNDPSDSAFNLFRLIVVAAIAGVLVGFVGGAFRSVLNTVGSKMLMFASYLHEVEGNWPVPGYLLTALITCVLVGIARYLVKFEPTTIGSGIQHVEAVMHNGAKPSRFRALPIKFIGGLLSICPGMALGKEGPTVQMAAVIGSECGKLFRLKAIEQSLLYTAVAGAGLSVAFNAPLAGIAFSIEEIAKKVSIKRVMVSLSAVVCGMIVYRSYFGDSIEFVVGDLAPDHAISLLFYALFSLLLSLIAVAYSRTVISSLNIADALHHISPVVKAMIVGFGVGLLGYFFPNWVGGGELQVEALLSQQTFLLPLVLMLIVRFLLGPICYTTGVPGGLFSPLLLMGSGLGVLFVLLVNPLLNQADLSQLEPVSFALVGMGAFFTVVVRSPLTGILLVIEMSGKVDLVIPLLISSVICTLIPAILRQEPIYDLLLNRKPS